MSASRRTLLAAALAAAWSAPCAAADIAPGLWEITVQARAPDAPGVAAEPFRLRQCLNAADAKDPSAVLGALANPGASDCSYSDKSYIGDTFRFTMRCAGGFGIVARGEIRYSADTMDGSISAAANVAGANTELRNSVSARRRGGCE